MGVSECRDTSLPQGRVHARRRTRDQLQFMQGVYEKWMIHAVEAVAANAYSTR